MPFFIALLLIVIKSKFSNGFISFIQVSKNTPNENYLIKFTSKLNTIISVIHKYKFTN